MNTHVAYTERELLRMSAAGDPLAFAQLFHLYKDPLYSYLLRLSDPATAEDIIQEVFLKLWANHSSLGQIEQFRAYIFRMAQHRILNLFKRKAKEILIIKELQHISASSRSIPEQNLSLAEMQRRLLEGVNSLSPQQKLIYTLSRDQGLPHDEIAQRLHLSPSTVNNHLTRALQILRTHLKWTTVILFMLKK